MKIECEFQINHRLLVYKLFYLFSLAGMSILPFLSLYFNQFGMSSFQIGMISAARPVCLSLSAPVIGYLTDKYQCPKIIVIVGGSFWIGSTIVMRFTLPKLEEKSCDLIANNLKQTSGMTCQNTPGKWLIATASNISMDNAEIETIPHGGYFDHRDMDVRQYGLSCENLNKTLNTDRSWLYTSKSLERVFYILLLTNSLFDMSFHPLHSIADAESVNTLQDMDIDIADYGEQRAFGSLGWALG